jgi:predicted SAM-dependent methyltransferase
VDTKKLNIGCGHDIREGWINLDSAAIHGVDVVHNLEEVPLPFSDEEFDSILAKDVLEHLDYVPVLKEIHRILKPGGTLEISVPHFSSVDNYVDPTHKKMFATKTFEFFSEQSPYSRDYYFDFSFQKIEEFKISFLKGVLLHNYVVEPVVNLSRAIQKLYEVTGWCRLFPAQNIKVTLVK